MVPSFRCHLYNIVTFAHLYLTTAYIFIDVEPWLNVSTGCTFPAPWINSTRVHERTNGTYTTQQPPNGTETTQQQPSGTEGVQQRPSDTEGVQQRPINEYVGDYEHLAFGNFTVYVRDDSLRYKFGLLLRGSLNAGETRDTFYMTTDYPFEYTMHMFPQFSRGFPVWFTKSARSDGKVDQVKVPFMEFTLPPVFEKGRNGVIGTGVNTAIPGNKASLTATSLAVIITSFWLM